VAFLLAVLEQRAGLDLSRADLYALAVGGVRVAEPAADLALVLAIASARLDRPIDGGTVAIGEVGLGGEVRQVGQTSRRLAEAARLGFTTALVPASVADAPSGLRLLRVATVAEALAHALPSAPGLRAAAG